MLEELYIQGKTIDDIAECLKGMPLHPHVVEVIKSAHALGYLLTIFSLFFSTCFLEIFDLFIDLYLVKMITYLGFRCDLKVVSDSNLFYIKTILEHYGIYNCFSEITTNPAFVDSGRLRISPFHDAASAHGCDICPPNLCKVHSF